MSHWHNKHKTAGTLLLEWVIALALSLFLSGLLVRLFQQTLTDRLAGEGRFAAVMTAATTARLLHDTLHLQGQLPCGHTTQQLNLVRHGSNTYWLNLFQQPVQIHAADSLQAKQIRRLGDRPGMRALGSDVLVTLNLEFPTAVRHHDTVRGTLTLDAPLNLAVGDFAVVCDDQLSVLFQITAMPTPQQVVWHNGLIFPGNCALQFDPQHPCAPQTAYRFSSGALLARLQPVTWFIGHSHTRKQRSLFRERLTLTHSNHRVFASMRREEMVTGVELLRAKRLPSDQLPQRRLDLGFVTAAYRRQPWSSDPVHLLGDDVSHWLSNAQWFYLSHEISLAR